MDGKTEGGDLARYRCVNCGVPCSTSSICATCGQRKQCARCRRYLPDVCFEAAELGQCRACRQKMGCDHRQRSALHETTFEHDMDVCRENDTFESLFHHLAHDIDRLADRHQNEMGSATFRFDADATFIRYLDDGTSSRVTGYFHSNRHIVGEGQPLDVQHIVKDLSEQVENFTKRGSAVMS